MLSLIIFCVELVHVSAHIFIEHALPIHHRKDLAIAQQKSPLLAIHEVVFEIRHQNILKLTCMVDEISDPDHPSYGQYLTKEEVDKLLVDPQAATAVVSYLRSHDNIEVILHEDRTASKQNEGVVVEYVKARAPIAVWEVMFKTNFSTYNYVPSIPTSAENMKKIQKQRNKKGKERVHASIEKQNLHSLRIYRTLSYSLPDELAKHVSAVYNTVQFPPQSRLLDLPVPIIEESIKELAAEDSNAVAASTSSNDRALFHSQVEPVHSDIASNTREFVSAKYTAPGYVNPKVLWAFHNVSGTRGNSRVSQAVYATTENAVSPSDLYIFQRDNNLRIYSLGNNYTSPYIADDACQTYSCNEGNLDTQYIMAMSQATPTNFTYWPGPDYWLSWIMSVASMANPPNVISISYASGEDELSSSYFHSFNIQALKLAAQGVTIISSSGNNGAIAPGSTSASCRYITIFPASSPYVTSVGGLRGFESNLPVVACSTRDSLSVFSSGGGFSNKFRSPPWQNDSITAYFKNTPQQPAPGFSRQGRGYPDISSLSRRFEIVVSGQKALVSGTSAATPTVAGLISLANAKRRAANMSPLGWINPLLYKYAQEFVVDAPAGKDNQCNTERLCCAQGFSTATGWDPMTGLGYLDYGRFLDKVMRLETRPNIPSQTPTRKPSAETTAPTTASGITLAPTSSPNFIRGAKWIYTITYDDTSCAGQPLILQAYPTNKCLPQYKVQSSPSFALITLRYVKYVSTTKHGMMQYFSDSACSFPLSMSGLQTQNLTSSSSMRLKYGCDLAEDSYYYNAEGYVSTYTSYSTNVEISSVFFNAVTSSSSNQNLQYITEKQFYTYGQCGDSGLSSLFIYPLNYCINLETFPNSRSYQISYPFFQYYDDTRCNLQPSYSYSSVQIPVSCSGAFSYPDGTSALSMIWTL